MRGFKVQLSQRTYEHVTQAAHDDGISASQYVREAVIARLWFESSARADMSMFQLAVRLAGMAEREGVTVEEIVQRLWARSDDP